MEVGSIWGHGSYVAPDWTADWLHRESSFVLTEWSNAEFRKLYKQLSPEDQGKLRGRLEQMLTPARSHVYLLCFNECPAEPRLAPPGQNWQHGTAG